jgi:SAM-dependent methyltransferase
MASNKVRRTIALEDRPCEICGSAELESLWSYKKEARTRSAIFTFDVNNVICPRCGFVFVSPTFAEESLREYYGQSYSAYAGQQPDYDIEKRIEFLADVTRHRNAFLEIGSNQPSEFHRRLREMFQRVSTVELNDSVAADRRALEDIPSGSVDVLAHYFVLEHIPRLRPFLAECGRVLADDGVMVCEVPDIGLYPTDPSGLELWEHTNHFSPELLDELLAQCGFRLVGNSHALCSRSFGFASAFVKAGNPAPPKQAHSHYAANRDSFCRGMRTHAQLARVEAENWASLQAEAAMGKPIIFWAANDVMARFVANNVLPACVIIVDSNPSKSDYFEEHEVHTPENVKDDILNSSAIYIFTREHAASILADLAGKYQKCYPPQHVHIVDSKRS